MTIAPTPHLDPRYGEPEASVMSWTEAEAALTTAEIYWLSKVRPDGRVHVTPLIGLWLDGGPVFTTGAQEQKADNLRHSPEVALTTGCNQLHGGTDLVVNGRAERMVDGDQLQAVADAFLAKYGEEWRFDVGDGVLTNEGHPAQAFRVEPTTAYAFGKAPYSHTRWDF